MADSIASEYRRFTRRLDNPSNLAKISSPLLGDFLACEIPMRLLPLLATVFAICLGVGARRGAAADSITDMPGVPYSPSAAQDLWNAVVADHHVANPHDPHTDPQHHAGDPHHSGDPHHTGDPHPTVDPHHASDPHHIDETDPHHMGDIHHTGDPHHTSNPHHFDDGHHHTDNHHVDPHHHAGPTHHDSPPQHHAGDPHSPTDPMHVLSLSITADSGGHPLLHVHETRLGDLNGDGHIDRNDALLHFGQSSFSQAVSLEGDVNYVQFTNGQDALILVDAAHLPENFDLPNALANLSVNGIPGLAGDYNQSGTVDAADYAVWRDTLGHTGAVLAADGNGTHQIDQGDYEVWRSHFGSIAANSGGSNSHVPEPAALIIALTACVWAVNATRRRRAARHAIH